jgi:hypothetical protein
MTKTQKTALALYLFLLLLCLSSLVVADFLGPIMRDTIKSVAGDGFKLVLGAVIGALSAILGASK